MILWESGYGRKEFESNFFEIPSEHPQPYRFFITEAGSISYTPGHGDFGLLVGRAPVSDFSLTLDILVPEGDYHFANSGIYINFADPRIDHPPHASWPKDASTVLQNRSRAFIADWTGYEIQLHADQKLWRRIAATLPFTTYQLEASPVCSKQNLLSLRRAIAIASASYQMVIF